MIANYLMTKFSPKVCTIITLLLLQVDLLLYIWKPIKLITYYQEKFYIHAMRYDKIICAVNSKLEVTY